MNLSQLLPPDADPAAVAAFRALVASEIESLLNWGRLYTKSAGCAGALSAAEVKRQFDDQKRKVLEMLK